MRYLIIYSLLAMFFWPAAAHATPCVNPAGEEGDQLYNITYHVMQYCNGSHWVAMGSVMGQGDNLGNRVADGVLDMAGFRIENLADPLGAADAATKHYADTKIKKSGDAMTGFLSLSGVPTANDHAANKEYVDLVVAGASGGASLPVDGSACLNWQEMRWIWDAANDDVLLTCSTSPSESCNTGDVGTVCASDGAIYIGSIGGKRIYAASADESAGITWGGQGETSGATSTTDGLFNTTILTYRGGHPAAVVCAAKPPAGMWYLPAITELNLLWNNGDRKTPPPPVGTPRINLTGIGIHTSNAYWSSTEVTIHYASLHQFYDGAYGNGAKNDSYRVRCVRR